VAGGGFLSITRKLTIILQRSAGELLEVVVITRKQDPKRWG